jgi:hypothetical protein
MLIAFLGQPLCRQVLSLAAKYFAQVGFWHNYLWPVNASSDDRSV